MSNETPEYRKAFREAAKRIWDDEKLRRAVAAHHSISAGNPWLFKVGLKQTIIDLKRWGDQDYLDELYDDYDRRFRGGKLKERDNWYNWSGDEFDSFRNFVHRDKLKELPEEEMGKPLTYPRIKKWYDEEWVPMPEGKKALYELEENPEE